MTRGTSLRAWQRAGILERECAFYRALAAKIGDVALVSYGGGVEEGELAQRVLPLRLLPNRRGFGANLYSVIAPVLHGRALRRARVLRTHQINGAWSAMIGKWLFRKKLVVRGGYMWSTMVDSLGAGPWRLRLTRALETLVLRAADRVVVPTDDDRAQIVRRGLSPAKVWVIPNYVDTDVFRPRPEVTPERGRLAFVGRLTEQKNLPALLDAMSGLDGVRLIVVGEGALRPALDAHARARDLAVEFVGRMPNVALPAMLARCEAFVLPSLYEGHPKALLEAMACGLPVVGAGVAGIRDVITHGETGYLCGTSAPEIRAALATVLGDRELARGMAARARAWVERECSLARVVDRELALLETL